MARDDTAGGGRPIEGQQPAAVPDWFQQALCRPGRSRYFESDGARLHLLTWNWEPEDGVARPAVLLVHGFMAHAHWWDTIAPWLARDFRVAALDLAGMGDSDARATYSGHGFARDVLAAIHHLGLAPATVIGHSYGGSRTLLASVMAPGAIAHAIVVDSFYNFLGEDPPGSPSPRPVRVFDSEGSALSRYRLVPAQNAVQPWIVENVARHSIKRIPQGWTWKFDPAMVMMEEADGASILGQVDARVDYVHAECSSLIDAARATRIMDALPGDRAPRFWVMKGLDHHVPLQDPVALRELLHRLLVQT